MYPGKRVQVDNVSVTWNTARHQEISTFIIFSLRPSDVQLKTLLVLPLGDLCHALT